MLKPVALALLALALLCAGCMAPRSLPPTLVASPAPSLTAWPRDNVTVEVLDQRQAPSADSVALRSLIEQTIVQALRTGTRAPGTPLQVQVAIVRHQVSFTPGVWHAETLLETQVLDAGQVHTTWTSHGEAHRVNMLGQIEMQTATNNAYERAMTHLLAQLAAYTPPAR